MGKNIKVSFFLTQAEGKDIMSVNFDFSVVDRILDEHERKKSSVIAILQDIQDAYRYLPGEVFPYLSIKLGISDGGIYSVATFYENFSLEPKGRFIIRVCDGTACSC